MKNPMAWCVLYGLMVVVITSNAFRANFCSWAKKPLDCFSDISFSCLNGEKCLNHGLYCNDRDDCGDNSDERYCSLRSCPEYFTHCRGYSKCIPSMWKCNGRSDCPNGVDENDCGLVFRVIDDQHITSEAGIAEEQIAVNNVKQWINDQRKDINSAEKWGNNVDRLALIDYLTDNSFTASSTNKAEMAYELNIQLLSRLSSMKLEDIPSTELASYVNAFLVMCINPRNFHGHDIVQELRNQVEKEKYTNPYVLLTLCNAGETITESDKNKLIENFENKHRKFWTSMQAVVVIALACANKQPGNEVDSETLREMTLELKQQQFRNGTVVDLPTTALVMQALISTDSKSDPDNFDEQKAFQELLQNQKPDGSFGDVLNTFLVTPVLTCKSLLDINSSHCQYRSRDEKSALENLSRRSGPKIRVQYSIWIGNEKDLERNLILRVPQNMSLYGVMEIAAEVDSRFKLEYLVKDSKPYVNAISGMRDNPLTGKFWFLYAIQDGKPTLSNESPAGIKPKDNDHYVM